MTLTKRTYSFSPDLIKKFESKVEPGKRSAVLSSIMTEWMELQEKKNLQKQIIEGCMEMAETYLEMEKEYHPLEEEADHEVHP